MRYLLAIIFVFLISGCVISKESESSNSVLLDYDDFGPQVMAHDLIGMKWWQWDSHGDPTPTECDIKVVVYRNVDISEISEEYPVNEGKKLDYRYLKYEDAVPFLEEKIEEDIVPSVTERLRKTLNTILKALGKNHSIRPRAAPGEFGR
jgi:predicted house-cleaning noncanonical NTP pyrophosphatase (MazG superfamily)